LHDDLQVVGAQPGADLRELGRAHEPDAAGGGGRAGVVALDAVPDHDGTEDEPHGDDDRADPLHVESHPTWSAPGTSCAVRTVRSSSVCCSSGRTRDAWRLTVASNRLRATRALPNPL